MANNTISLRNQQLFDAAAIAQSVPYINNGLTYVSNNTDIHPRDESGNIILQENSETNPLLIIEPAVNNVLNQSVLRVVDTAFQYYKFPVTTRTAPVADLDVNINLQTDPVYARYKPSENRFINAAGIPSGILMDEVVEGLSQSNTNSYYISKEIKNSGVDIRIRAKIAHYFLSSGDFGTCYFTITRGGPNKPLNRYYRPIQTTNPGNEVYANDVTVNGQYIYGGILQGQTQNLFIDEIIPNSEFDIGDSFGIGAVAGQAEQHTIFSEQTYMVVTDASKNVDEWNQEIIE